MTFDKQAMRKLISLGNAVDSPSGERLLAEPDQ